MATEENTNSRDQVRKRPIKRSTAGESPKRNGTAAPRRDGNSPRAAPPKRLSGGQVASRAARQLLELTGREAEGVTSLQRTDDGWSVQVELVEVRRIPDTTDVLAVYEVEVDSRGELQGYRRLKRYSRGVAGEE
jgi:hypothetical protein